MLKQDKALGGVRRMDEALRALRSAEREMARELESMKDAIRVLASAGTRSIAGRAGSGPRRLSPQGREAIARAARKRWAQYRADKERAARKSTRTKTGRTR